MNSLFTRYIVGLLPGNTVSWIWPIQVGYIQVGMLFQGINRCFGWRRLHMAR